MICIERELLNLVNKSRKKGEVPVAAIIVKNNKIIAKAFNQKEKKHDIMGHAEIIAIRKASKKLKSWNLENCEMYCTLEPCNMCREIIKQSRILNVYYFLGNNKNINYKTKFNKISNEYNEIYKEEVKKFFEKLR